MPLLIGHRGYPRCFPENTLASLMATVLAGADGAEFDVRLGADGVPVLSHDEGLERVAGVALRIHDTPLEELRRIHLGMGQTLASLEDVLRALPPGITVFVELKEVEAAAPAVETVRRLGRGEEVIYISFLPEALEAARRLEPSARLCST